MEERLLEFGRKIIDQQLGKCILEPTQDEEGYWIGAGNALEDESK